MRLVIKADYDGLSNWAAEHVIESINKAAPTKDRPFVLGLPTGGTPIGMYQALVKGCKAGRGSFKNVVTLNMEESVGFPVAHPQS